MKQKIPELTHQAVNHLNGISTIAGCLIDKLKDAQGFSSSLRDEFIKALNTIETRAKDISNDIIMIKEELSSRGQYS